MRLVLLLLFISMQPSILDAAPRVRSQSARVWPRLSRAESRDHPLAPVVQYLLKHRGFYQGNVDYNFGPQTERAVRAFQRSKGLKVDGVVGSQTWEKLIVPLKRGDRGDAVRAIQTFLDFEQPENGSEILRVLVDGVFGAATEKKVRWFQDVVGQKVDGRVSAHTWHRWLRQWS